MRIGVVLVLIVLVGVCTAGFVYVLSLRHEQFPEGTQSLPYIFTVASTPGIDTRTDVFRLGQVSPGGGSWRQLHIESGLGSITRAEQAERQVLVVARGDGSAWLAITPAIVTLPADVNISLRAPLAATLGTYEGTIYVLPYSG